MLWYQSSARKSPADSDAKSIAVLPFENLGENKENVYFVDGMQDEVIAVSYAILGDADRAVPLLERCLSARYRRCVTPALLQLDPVWDKIRTDPRFQELVKRAN